MGNYNGTYIPSCIPVEELQNNKAFGQLFDDSSIHVGVVVASYLVNDTNNTSKFRTEYDVTCDVSTNNGSTSTITYYRAKVMTMFGGVADHSDYTLRADPMTNNGNGNFISKGATVLLVCINGDAGRTYIIGSAKNRTTPAESSNEGHHLTWVFNGVDIRVLNDGSFNIKHNGPTDLDGNITDQGNYTQMLFKADGSIELSNAIGDSFVIEKQKATLTSTEVIVDAGLSATVKSPSITLTNGVEVPYPVMIAHPSYLEAFFASQGGVTAFVSAVSAFANEVVVLAQTQPPTQQTLPFVPLLPTAAAVVAACTALLPLIEQHSAAVEPGIEISVTTDST